MRLAISPDKPPVGFPNISPRLIVVLAADYCNLGDVALTHALLRLARQHLPSHRPYLLTAGNFFREIKGAANAAGPDDVVAIVGGGNMGDLYPYLEEARLQTVRAFPRNRIISFPQSFGFSDTASGRHAARRSAKIYASHPDLVLFARERESYEMMRTAFPGVRVELAPDTVLSLKPLPSAPRDLPLVVCLRDDKEAKLSPEVRGGILQRLASEHPGARIIDTLAESKGLSYAQYEKELISLLETFSRSRCIVTDRLHGMIFSVITGTPCVVLENNNHKIRATVSSWLGSDPALRFVAISSAEEVSLAVRGLLAANPSHVTAPLDFSGLAAALRGVRRPN